MEKNELKLGVALTRCFFCGEAGDLLIDRRLRVGRSPVDACHDKARTRLANSKVSFSLACSKCEGYMKQGVILISIDDAKSDEGWNKPPTLDEDRKGWMPNPHRAGFFGVVTDDCIRRLINEPALVKWALKRRWMFIEHEVCRVTGLLECSHRI